MQIDHHTLAQDGHNHVVTRWLPQDGRQVRAVVGHQACRGGQLGMRRMAGGQLGASRLAGRVVRGAQARQAGERLGAGKCSGSHTARSAAAAREGPCGEPRPLELQGAPRGPVT